METLAPVENTTTDKQDHDDNDKLGHFLCPVCTRTDKQRAKPPAARCGKRQYGWKPTPQRPLCVVCVELMKTPCPRCGHSYPHI